MKPNKSLHRIALASLISFAGAGVLPAEEAEDIGLLPDGKMAIRITAEERNPFAKRASKRAAVAHAEDTDSQEQKIRAALSDMKVTGVVGSERGVRVLLGTLSLELGRPIPPIVSNQTQQLIVTDVTEKQVEISWVEKARDGVGRKILIPIDLKARVNFRLGGHAGTKGAPLGFWENNPDREEGAIATTGFPTGD